MILSTRTDSSLLFVFHGFSADGQEEAWIHQEQAVPEKGQETDQEIFIEHPTPAEAHSGREGGREKRQTFKIQAATENPPIKDEEEDLSCPALSPGGPNTFPPTRRSSSDLC